jgi:hypothetical protein
MFKEHEYVVLTHDLSNEGLTAGDLGTVIHIHNGGAAYEVEFTTLLGKTIAIATLKETQLRSISDREVAHVREFSRA